MHIVRKHRSRRRRVRGNDRIDPTTLAGCPSRLNWLECTNVMAPCPRHFPTLYSLHHARHRADPVMVYR